MNEFKDLKKVEKTGKFVVDSLLMMLLLGMLALPISSIGLLQVKTGQNSGVGRGAEVLPSQSIKVKESDIDKTETAKTVKYISEIQETSETSQTSKAEKPALKK